jgi:hypothetical protein
MLRGMILQALAFTAFSSDSHLGVDDWGASEISQFFEKAGVQISEESINKAGLSPQGLFDGHVTIRVLQELRVTGSLQQNRALNSIQDLDDTITHAPGDFFEWRVATCGCSTFGSRPWL